MSCKEDRSTPFWDTSLSENERLDWLLENMTLDEKLHSVSSGGYDLERLGIPRIRKTGYFNLLSAADRDECILGYGVN